MPLGDDLPSNRMSFVGFSLKRRPVQWDGRGAVFDLDLVAHDWRGSWHDVVRYGPWTGVQLTHTHHRWDDQLHIMLTVARGDDTIVTITVNGTRMGIQCRVGGWLADARAMSLVLPEDEAARVVLFLRGVDVVMDD